MDSRKLIGCDFRFQIFMLCCVLSITVATLVSTFGNQCISVSLIPGHRGRCIYGSPSSLLTVGMKVNRGSDTEPVARTADGD